VGYPYRVRINDFAFGSDPGTGLPAEFNITPFLNDENNTIDLEPGLSDPDSEPEPSVQDCSATLIIRDNIHVRDLVVSSYRDPESTEALVRFHLFLKSYLTEKSMGRSIRLLVEDPEGNAVINETQALGTPLSFGQETEMIMDHLLENPVHWSPLLPNLYQLEIQVSEPGKKAFETISTHFGFRTVIATDSLILVNGDTLNPVFGPPGIAEVLSGLTKAEIEQHITEQGFNAIRTGEPLPCNLVHLFDRKGLLVIRRAGKQEDPSHRLHINSPSIIRAD